MKQLGFSRAQAEDLAKVFFAVSLPISRDDFKKAYRQACKLLHTDTSGTDATKEQFIRMKEFYDTICHQNPTWAFVDGLEEPKTEEGIPLSECGLGLGPHKNGRECADCKGKGYTTSAVATGYVRCGHCYLGYSDRGRCRDCKGTGKFTLRSQRVVDCRRCKGTGEYLRRRMGVCDWCHGNPIFGIKGQQTIYQSCWRCKRTGEIEIFNPVIPKGRL